MKAKVGERDEECVCVSERVCVSESVCSSGVSSENAALLPILEL